MLKVNVQKLESALANVTNQIKDIEELCLQEATSMGIPRGYSQTTIEKFAEFIKNEEHPELEKLYSDRNNLLQFFDEVPEPAAEPVADTM